MRNYENHPPDSEDHPPDCENRRATSENDPPASPDHSPASTNMIEIPRTARASAGEFLRQWGLYILTAVLMPGGIVLALLVLWARWHRRRQVVQARLQRSASR